MVCKYDMDKNTLKELIKQVADIQELTPKKDPKIRLDDGVDEEVRVGNEWVEINSKINPTLGFKFIKLKEQPRLCQLGCGEVVVNQVVERRLAHTPQKHWRTRCQTCGCYVSPDGVGFIDGGHKIAAAYLRYFRGESIDIEPRDSEASINKNGQEYVEKSTNDGVIRIYK